MSTTLALFTIGHSTHPIERFLELLTQHRIDLVVDVRRFPGSRKFPQFNRENLAAALKQAGIEYRWIESLGGRRPASGAAASKNLGLRNESFRHYADYMATAEFRDGLQQLLDAAADKRTAYMCSESVFWRCHRRLISDYLLAQRITVQHIMPTGALHPHTLTTGAKIVDGEVTYPAADPGATLF
jgi:uncharacterized protein (DUF488 family)